MKTKQSESNGGSERLVRQGLMWCWVPLAIALVWTACKPEASAQNDTKAAGAKAADINPVGTYSLVTVDGKPVPCTLQHEGHTMTINTGSFVINTNGTCISRITLAGRDVPIERKADYTRESTKLTMRWQNAGTTLGTIEGDTFTMNNEGMVFVYRR